LKTPVRLLDELDVEKTQTLSFIARGIILSAAPELLELRPAPWTTGVFVRDVRDDDKTLVCISSEQDVHSSPRISCSYQSSKNTRAFAYVFGNEFGYGPHFVACRPANENATSKERFDMVRMGIMVFSLCSTNTKRFARDQCLRNRIWMVAASRSKKRPLLHPF